jgi:hypothetical protein
VELEAHLEGKVHALLVSALDGDATDAELQELNALIAEHPALCRSAARFLCDDSYLAGAVKSLDEVAKFSQQLHAEAMNRSGLEYASADIAAQRALANGNAPTERSATTSLSSLPPARADRKNILVSALQFANRHGLLVAATAAAIVAMLVWQNVVMRSEFERLHTIAARPSPGERDESRGGNRRGATDGLGSTVARVTGLVGCEWPTGTTPLKFGDPLAPGQRLQVEKGLMQVTFGTGAKVVLEGPTDFTVTTPGQATLQSGKIAAAVPRFARGYTILTPTAEIVDLGTEFGVDVDSAGRSQIHVFEGDVVARPRDGASHSELIQARQDEAVEFIAPTEKARRIPADSSRFVRRLTPDLAADKLPLLPVTTNLVLWLAADMIPESVEHAPISTWSDILVGDNRFADDAWQFAEQLRPTWVRDQEGRPAVRFDGWSTYLATSPMATGDRMTAFVVFAQSPVSFASDFHGGMLLKFGGDVPSLEFSVMPDRAPRGQVWSRGDDGSKSYVGELRGRPVEPQVTSIAAYSYDVKQNLAELFVNGQSAGTTTAPRQLEQNARKYIGAHAETWWQAYFSGNIYEILVYDSALDARDRERVFNYLADRYGIQLDK